MSVISDYVPIIHPAKCWYLPDWTFVPEHSFGDVMLTEFVS